LMADQQFQRTKDDVKREDEVDVRIEAEILQHLAEKVLFDQSQDGKARSIQEPQEVVETEVFNQTEEHVLDSNCVMITPMVISPKAKRKKGSKTPKNERKNIKSPLLRRKEIRTCISLHNECETSEVLEELIRPAISYGSNLNIVETVEDTPEIDPIQADLNTVVDHERHNKAITSSLSGKMSTPGQSWFPWKTLSFLLLISTAAIINLDCQKHGSFSKSNTGQFLQDIGQYDRVIGGYQVMLDRTKEGRMWVDSNVPLYLEQAKKVGGPYYEVAVVKAGEVYDLVLVGYGKLEVAVKAGVVKLEGWVPGAQEQLNNVGQAVAKGGQAIWSRTQQGMLVMQQGAVDLMNGEVDWVAVKANAVARAQIVQGQLVAAVNYIQGQVNQLVK